MYDPKTDTSLRGAFRVSGYPHSGNPEQVCPQTNQRYEDRLKRDSLADRRADTTFLSSEEARLTGLSAYGDIADELARRDEPSPRRGWF